MTDPYKKAMDPSLDPAERYFYAHSLAEATRQVLAERGAPKDEWEAADQAAAQQRADESLRVARAAFDARLGIKTGA